MPEAGYSATRGAAGRDPGAEPDATPRINRQEGAWTATSDSGENVKLQHQNELLPRCSQIAYLYPKVKVSYLKVSL